jgi:predicted transcriptional regulator
MESVTVRIPTQLRDVLKAMAEQMNQSMQDVITRAVENYRRELFFAQANEAYARMMADPVQKAEHEAELREWDGTLMDGLDPDEQWNEDGSVVVKHA